MIVRARVCVCVSKKGGWGVLGMVGMDEECQKAKEGEIMKTKVKKWFIPSGLRWRGCSKKEPELGVPDLLADGRRRAHKHRPQKHVWMETLSVTKRGLKQSHKASPQEM